MSRPRILLVEDEQPLVTLLTYNLEAEGFAVEAENRGDTAAERLRDDVPDLLVLDWMLPGISGIELCRRLRQRQETKALPIVMLTARGEESERIRGLATGADDYVVKPFSVAELMARVKALLRRANPGLAADVIAIGDLKLDRTTRRVHRGPREVRLGPTEFRLLECLMRSPGRVYGRDQLLDQVWGRDAEIDDRTVDVHVGRLRKAVTAGEEADPIRPCAAPAILSTRPSGASDAASAAAELKHGETCCRADDDRLQRGFATVRHGKASNRINVMPASPRHPLRQRIGRRHGPGACRLLHGRADGWPHPSDLEALPRADWPKPQGGEVCNDAGTSVRSIGDKAFRFAFATITRPGATERIGAFLTISRIEGDKDVPLGRFVLPLALVEGRSGAHGVQLTEACRNGVRQSGADRVRTVRPHRRQGGTPAERRLVRRPDALLAGQRCDWADPQVRSRDDDGFRRRP